MVTIGIDLGTTNSLGAYWNEDGPKIIPNSLGSNLTPSVVSTDNGEILVGQIAKERLISHPHLTAAAFKRYMGTDKKYNLGKHSFSPEELSSFIIRSLKEDAEAFLNNEVKEAVISVPAYFNDAQRKATKRAGELAGLKVERLISEPTAAAIAYGLHQERSETKFLVFDLGGGTFDASILELFEGVMEVKSIAGDNFLGGEDFTNLLVSYFAEKNKLDWEKLDLKTRSLLYKQAELCKIEFSNKNSGKMALQYDGKNLEIKLDNTDFERLVNPLLLRIRQPIERVLRDSNLTPIDLDAVILIGGATKMPVIRTAVTRMFGKIPYSNINPDEAVALGAAVQVALKERNSALDEVVLTDVCPYTLGVEVVERMNEKNYESGYFLPIIERNTTIPVSRVERLTTVSDFQTQFNFKIFQGESRKVENNIKLGELKLKVLPEKAGEQKVDVRFTYDINGILEVEATIVNTGEQKSIIIEKTPGSMTEKEIRDRLNLLSDLKIHPRERAENRLLIARGERIYEESIGTVRLEISEMLRQFDSVLSTQDLRLIKKAAEKLKNDLDYYEGRLGF